MSNAIQYTYGLIGASESSTTRAMLLVPCGAPAQLSGGVVTREPAAHVYRRGIMFCWNAPLFTVIALGAESLMDEPNSPHPASGTAQPTAASPRRISPS